MQKIRTLFDFVMEDSTGIKSFKGVEYTVMKLTYPGFYGFASHYLAYIKLPDRHPWIGSSVIPIEVHGGITFDQRVTKKSTFLQNFTPGNWIGWDYAHMGDYTGLIPALEDTKDLLWPNGWKKWTRDEVEEEVHEAIDSILNAY